MSQFASSTPAPLTPSDELLAGLTATLRRWSALRAAVSDQWGGPSSHAKADSLRLSLHSQLTAARGVPDAHDLGDDLLIYMEEEFSCQLEDGSPADIAGILVEMASACSKGDFELARRMVQNAELERASLEGNKVALQVEGEMSDDDDEMADTAPAPQPAASYTAGSLFADPAAPQAPANQPPPRQLGEAKPAREVERVVDEDGFEAVAPRRSRRKEKLPPSNVAF
jgi:pre-rRNA-processing protein TSR2